MGQGQSHLTVTPAYHMGDLRQEKSVDIKDLKNLPMELHQDFIAFLVKPPVWSMEDWQEKCPIKS